MSIHIKTMLIGVSLALALGFTAGISVAQSTGPAALAAKQEIKAQVLAAMSDGKISQYERRDILVKAKDICTAKEYVGLVQTINRLSMPDPNTPEDLGYTPLVDKQLMANFPAPDLSWLDKTKLGGAISRQSFVNEIIPKQNNVVQQTMPKQTVVVREIITKQTIVREITPKQAVAKAAASKQPVAKAATPKQSVAKQTTSKQSTEKTTKQNAASKVVMVPPEKKLNKQTASSTTGKEQNKITKTEKSIPPIPPAELPKIRDTNSDKPVQHKMAEKNPIKPSYTDHSVPVLSASTAAVQSKGNSEAVKASYGQSFEPDEYSQSIIR